METDTIAVTIRMTKEVEVQLKARAKSLRRSRSSLGFEIIERFFAVPALGAPARELAVVVDQPVGDGQAQHAYTHSEGERPVLKQNGLGDDHHLKHPRTPGETERDGIGTFAFNEETYLGEKEDPGE